MSNIKYDEKGGIVSLEKPVDNSSDSNERSKSAYNFLEKFMLKRSKKLNYLLDSEGN